MSIKVVFGFILISLLTACAQTKFELSNGDTVNLSEYKGHWLLINYWAVWCKPCLEEIPELNAVNKNDNISVIGVNFDRQTGEKLKEQVTKMNIEFPIILDEPAKIFSQKKPNVLPATMVINPQGKFVRW